jgi:hypothetical protein
MDPKLVLLFLLIGTILSLSHFGDARNTAAIKAPIRFFITALAIVLAADLAAATAHAQGMGKGKRHQKDAPKAQDAAQNKAADASYQKALNAIPASHQKFNPWGNVR